VVVGGLGGLLTVFIFGTIYSGNAQDGAYLLLLENGLYADDWSAFGAFVAAPVGGLLWGFGALALRLSFQWVMAKIKGRRFDALDRPTAAPPASFYSGRVDEGASDEDRETAVQGASSIKGKFF